MTRFLLIFLIIHILFCLAIYILSRQGVFRATQLSVVLALLVPIWGPLCFIILEIKTRFFAGQARELGLEKLVINDEVHRSILMDEDTVAERVVPLEEALLLNDAATRRELMMDILYADPGDYVDQLQTARMNDDGEVVHYAVTALVELQKEYDLEFQRLERVLALDPDDEIALGEIIRLSERYLSSGLLDGNARRAELYRYSGYLGKRLEQTKNASLMGRKIDADLKLGEYAAAEANILDFLKTWPEDERGYLFEIRYCAAMCDRRGIDEALEKLKENDIYISPSGREEVRFWTRNAELTEVG